jgi:hypothetical protein
MFCKMAGLEGMFCESAGLGASVAVDPLENRVDLMAEKNPETNPSLSAPVFA